MLVSLRASQKRPGLYDLELASIGRCFGYLPDPPVNHVGFVSVGVVGDQE